MLGAMGLPVSRVDSALRISLGHRNSREDIDALCEGIKSAQEKLRRAK